MATADKIAALLPQAEGNPAAMIESPSRAGATSCWAVRFLPLPHPIDASPGQNIRVFGSHDRHRVSIWCDPQAICRVPSDL